MRNKGFTLIEIIIVLVIIGVMSSVVVLSVTAPSYSRFMGSVEKLSSTMSILADEAVYSSSVISCQVTPNSMECRRYFDGDWSELPIRKLVSWGWPKDLKILRVLQSGVSIHADEPIRFFPSGDNPALSIQVGDGSFTAWIDSDLTGRYKVSN